MKKPIVIQSRFVPKHFCINLFGTFWARDTGWIDHYVVNHERIHTAQMRELLFVPFYLAYVLEWVVRMIQYRNRDLSYRNISFEREAYANGDNLDYLATRRRFAWIKYLRTGS